MSLEPTQKITRNGNLAVYLIEGDLTASTAPDIRNELKKVIAEGARDVVVDLTNTYIVDSTGIGLLVATHNSLLRLDGKFSVTNVSKDLMDLFKAFRLEKHFSVSANPKRV